ncbi:hypothetical protein KFE98_18835 [bacterium SCSIO 12741]|nr:hypothetical protein KFE98_18835 [bacterium SCSIO 12741]
MKKSQLYVLLIAILMACSVGVSAQSSSYCPKDEVVVKCRKALVPYKYTNMVVKRIVYKRYNHIDEVSIPLYYDARYRIVFNTELLPKDIKIEIYDKAQGEKKRKLLASFESSEKQFNYEPDDDGIYQVYVNFLIPAYIADDGSSFLKGCLVMMTGYEDEIAESFSNGGGEE